jgi:hypothetical protein
MEVRQIGSKVEVAVHQSLEEVAAVELWRIWSIYSIVSMHRAQAYNLGCRFNPTLT